MYVFLVGHPGVGKTRTVHKVSEFVRELTEFHIGDTSMTMASLVDRLVEAKRTVINMPHPPLEFNSMFLLADELSAFMSKYDDELIGGLTTFWDVNVPYSQSRRGRDIRIKIKKPQLSILCGTTPSNLMKFMPEMAWDQGFTSRVIMVFSDERPMLDIFNIPYTTAPAEMIHDLRVINSLHGEFQWSPEYAKAVQNWRELGQPPLPNHPKLIHYTTRRLAHLLKLTMVASADRGDDLQLTVPDFNTAMGWLIEAEQEMSEIFKAGASGADGKAMDEIYHYIVVADAARKGVSEQKIVNFARERVPAHSVLRVLEVMERSGMIKATAFDPKTGLRIYSPTKEG